MYNIQLYKNDNNLFKLIYIKNLNNMNNLNHNQKIRHLNRIKVLNSFKYYEELVININFLLTNLFIKSKKTYNIIIKFIKFLKFKKNIIFNNEDLLCDNILNSNYIFKINISKFIYQFTYNDFVDIIKNSLFNYRIIESSDIIDNIIIKPDYIKNPYTNLNFKKNVLYNFYIFCINNNKQVPLLFKLFYKQNFNLKDFFIVHEIYIISNAYKIYIKNSNSSTKYKILLSLINTFVNFINKYIKNFSIKYLLSNYKIKFHNLSSEEIDYYDNYLHDYMLLIYFYKNKQYKNCINIKLKFVFKLLHDTNIRVIDPIFRNLLFSKFNEHYIINFLLTNLENIISNEISILDNDLYTYRIIYQNNERIEINDSHESTENNETSETIETIETTETIETFETNEANENNILNNTILEDNFKYINLYNKYKLLIKDFLTYNKSLIKNLYNKYKLLIKDFLTYNNFNTIISNSNIILLKIFIINIQIYVNLLLIAKIILTIL